MHFTNGERYVEPKYSKLTCTNIARTVFTLMGILSEEASPLYFVSLLSRGQLFKERSKFSPLRVDHMSKSYAHPEKQIEIHASLGNIDLETIQGVFIRAEAVIRINAVILICM